MYVVNSLEEKQKVYVVVSVVEHLLTQVKLASQHMGERKTDKFSPYLSWGSEGQTLFLLYQILNTLVSWITGSENFLGDIKIYTG